MEEVGFKYLASGVKVRRKRKLYPIDENSHELEVFMETLMNCHYWVIRELLMNSTQ